MPVKVEPVDLAIIEPFRDIYRQEMSCQIIFDSIHARHGWTQEYLLEIDGQPVGYGSVAKAGPWSDSPAIYEFYVIPQFRTRTFDLFDAFVAENKASAIETQTNDFFLTTMLFSFTKDVNCESILFHDKTTTSIEMPPVKFRAATSEDNHQLQTLDLDAESQWIAAIGDQLVGVGRLLNHYNRPYQDLSMKVVESHRGQGIGAFIVQELKRVCYASGNIPAARCNPTNLASRQTLQKAGFVPCASLIKGTIIRNAK